MVSGFNHNLIRPRVGLIKLFLEYETFTYCKNDIRTGFRCSGVTVLLFCFKWNFLGVFHIMKIKS